MKYCENLITSHEYIPCIDTSNNKIGVYDTIEDKFYTDPNDNNFIASDSIIQDFKR